jgi:dTDP-4-dehydrorhamnose 3,5-epimerase-like enzyme
MASFLELNTFSDERGFLSVIEKILPFDIKRVFFIYNVKNSKRGGHRHKKTIQAAICVSGECKIYCNNSINESIYHLKTPNKCLILEPNDWHTMYDFSENTILLVLASEEFDESDYIYTSY